MKLFLTIFLFITLTAFVNSCSKSGAKFREGTIELKLSPVTLDFEQEFTKAVSVIKSNIDRKSLI